MKYEDKLKLVVEALHEKRLLSVKGFPTQLIIDGTFVFGVAFDEVWKILLKLMLEEDILTADKQSFVEDYSGILTQKTEYTVEYWGKFDKWYAKRTKDQSDTSVAVKPFWPDDFRWVGDKFMFGKFGEISFSSRKRKMIFDRLTRARGHWVRTKDLEKDLPENYVGKTIAQIEELFPKAIRKSVFISSTKEKLDTFPKPGFGAYRMRVLPELNSIL